jgi:hypothetical protein
MKPFYLNGMLRSLVFALVGIFTPVYLFKLGMDLFGDVRYGVMLVGGYFVLTRLTTVLSVVPISWLIERIGFRRSIFISLFILAVNLGTLLFASEYAILILVSAIAGGLNIPFYWVARSSAISQDSDNKHVGSQMAIMTTAEQVTTLLGPLSAGLLVEKWGFQSLYTLALVILFVSAIPLWGMRPHVHKNGATWRGFFQWIRNPRYFHIGVGVGARAIDDYSISVLWPLAIFVMGVKAGIMGGIFSTVALTSLVVRILMGKMFDKLRSRGDWSDEILYMLSAGFSSIAWIVRLFVGSIGSILMLDMTGAVFGTIYASFYIDYEQLGGKRMGSILYWVYGEMMYSMMTILLFSLVMIGAWYGVWQQMFMILASFWVLVSMVMAKESNMK